MRGGGTPPPRTLPSGFSRLCARPGRPPLKNPGYTPGRGENGEVTVEGVDPPRKNLSNPALITLHYITAVCTYCIA